MRPSIRFTATLDAETERFEEELLRRLPIELSLGQTHCYLKETSREFRVFQMRDPAGDPAMQAVIYVSRSRLSRSFAHATVPKMGFSCNDQEEQRGIRLLRKACIENDNFMTLRLQPYRTEQEALVSFESRALEEGFHLAPPTDTTRTLLFDLRQAPDELLAGLKKSTRSRIKHKSREQVTLQSIVDPTFIPRCREAEKAAHDRTGGKPNFDFETLFRVAEKFPDRAFAMGLFLNSRPHEMLAFVTGLRHGKLAEYTSAGSFRDPELRTVPFNSFLLWELILWARKSGAEQLDLGGITDGGPGDPLAGISEFKRYFCEIEAEIGREMITILKPGRYAVFQTIQKMRGR